MEKKERKDRKRERNQPKKKESNIVTKESFCATFLLFSVLALIVLFSRKAIFGDEIGFTVYSFFLGSLGYMAYPVMFGVFYLSLTGLFGKRLVKNRLVGVCIGAFIVCAALLAHTIMDFSACDDKGYLSYCFNAGEIFLGATVTGWVGGLLIHGIALLTTNIGAVIIFSLLTAFCGYLTVMTVRKSILKRRQNSENGQADENGVIPVEIPLNKEQQQGVSATQIPLQRTEISDRIDMGGQAQQVAQSNVQPTYFVPQNNAYESGQAQVSGQSNYGMPVVQQRPGVQLSEENVQKEERSQMGAFSPFATPYPASDTDSMEGSYKNSREFLFGGTPAENYRRNLIFDPNSRVNQRPIGEAEPPTIPTNTSYTESYQDSFNSQSIVAPAKIVSNHSSDYSEYSKEYVKEDPYGLSVEETPTMTPMQPIEPTVLPQQPLSQSTYERESSQEVYGESTWTEREPLFEENTRNEQTEYRRHDYMDLFSPSNPNVFGRETEENTSDFIQGREEERSENLLEERGERFSVEPTRGYEEREETSRRGINLFDEEEEDPYALRSEFDDRNGVSDVSSRGVERENFELPERESTRGFGRDSETEIPLETSRMQDVRPVVEPISAPTPPPAPTPVPKKPRIIRPYVRVPLDDFDCRDIQPTQNEEEVEQTKANIIATLEEFKITGASIASVTFGPTVTRYNVTIPRSISPKKVVALDQSIAISLYSSGVNVYPNYEDGVVSIEVPNKNRQFVQLGCMLSGDTFVNAKSSSLMFTMGKDVANRKVYGDISKMVHMLVAGSSGSGKSVFLGSLIISLIYKYSPEELRLILIDPKKTEFVLYNDLPHLMINEIITDAHKAVQSLNWAIGEMNRRYTLFEQMSRTGTYVVNLDQYNEQLEKAERLPKIVIIIDELADLMLAAKKEMEERIQNLTQKARAAGIHLIVATQRPSTDVITGVIKSNLATRVAFYVATDVDSRVILDQTGAQKLLGKGDLLYTMPGIASPIRVQSAFISPEDSQKVVNFIKRNNEAYYDEEATAFINSRGGNGGEDPSSSDGGSVDPMYIEALKHVIISGSASISMIQRKCSAGFNRAGKIIEWMEDMGYISPFDGAKARKVLITREEFESKYGPLQ